MTRVIVCTCKHKFQDVRYGRGKRLHNFMKKDGKANGWRCTVCSNVKERGAS